MTGKNAFITQGAFITLEGIDGCGKSTQANLLCRWLENLLGIARFCVPLSLEAGAGEHSCGGCCWRR